MWRFGVEVFGGRPRLFLVGGGEEGRKGGRGEGGGKHERVSEIGAVDQENPKHACNQRRVKDRENEGRGRDLLRLSLSFTTRVPRLGLPGDRALMVEYEAGEGRTGGGKKACTARMGNSRRGKRSWRRRRGCDRIALGASEGSKGGAGRQDRRGCCCSCGSVGWMSSGEHYRLRLR